MWAPQLATACKDFLTCCDSAPQACRLGRELTPSGGKWAEVQAQPHWAEACLLRQVTVHLVDTLRCLI
jgi:hypothetical protein